MEEAILMMQDDIYKVEKHTDDVLEYESDSRFITYMKSRLEQAARDREANKLIDSEEVFADIRNRHGW
jgi:hypothetical protein